MNFEQLSSPATKDEVREFMTQHSSQQTVPFYRRSLDTLDVKHPLLLVISLFLTLFLAVVMLTIPISFGLRLIGVAALVVFIVMVFVYVSKVSNFLVATRSLHIARFARANGWEYKGAPEGIYYPSMLFASGSDLQYSDIVSSPDFEMGRARFYIGSGRNRKLYQFGFMVLTLERRLPHMLLDGRSNNMSLFGASLSNLPMQVGGDQIDLLEGDFNKYYTLYAPKEYGSDIRYIFTPDVMQTLIEESDKIDIEIIDNKLFVYFGEHALDNPAFWQRAVRLKDKLNDKLVERAGSRYRDDRASDGVVAVQGRRLKRGTSIVAIILIILYLILASFDITDSVTSLFK